MAFSTCLLYHQHTKQSFPRTALSEERAESSIRVSPVSQQTPGGTRNLVDAYIPPWSLVVPTAL